MNRQLRKLGRRVAVTAAAAAAASAVAAGLPGAAGGATTAIRTHYSSVVANTAWRVEEGCVVTYTQVSAYDSATRSRVGGTAVSEVGVWVSEYDSCRGESLSSWQGTVQAQPGELELPSDLQTARIRAQVPVTDYVTGRSATVAVDVRLTARGLAIDQKGSSHFHSDGFVANWSGTYLVYDAVAAGSIVLDGRELAGEASSASLSASDFGETDILRQELLARAVVGAVNRGPMTLSVEGVTAYWSGLDEGGCRLDETTVTVRDIMSWDGTGGGVVSFYSLSRDLCGAGEVTGVTGEVTLDDVAFTINSTSKAVLRGTFRGTRVETGEGVPISLDLAWAGRGTRSVWELTLHYATAFGRSTSHHNEAWRQADVTGSVLVGGAALGFGTPAAAELHRERNIVTNG